MDDIDRKLLNRIQRDFPLEPRPFAALGTTLGLGEAEALERLRALKAQGIVRQISAIFDTRRLGYQSSLVAMRVTPDRADQAAAVINQHPGVSHNYLREHAFNIWFTLAVPPTSSLEETAARLGELAGAAATRLLPTLRRFKIGVSLDMTGEEELTARQGPAPRSRRLQAIVLGPQEIEVIRILQEDLPLEPAPFLALAGGLGMRENELLSLARALIQSGQMRRFAAVLHHRKAGFLANAMGVWVVPPARLKEVGRQMATFRAVSHCYQRPTYPDWPYNVFTMVHGRTKEECEGVLAAISEATGIRNYAALYSTKEYKKARVRYFSPELDEWEARFLQTTDLRPQTSD